MRGRTFTLVFSSADEATEFLKTIEKMLPGRSFLGELKTNKVKIFIPESEDMEETITKIRQLYNQRHRRLPGRAPKKYSVASLFSLANIETPVPASLVVDVLRIKGHRATLEEDFFVTTAELNEILDIIKGLSSVYKILLEFRLTPQARRLTAIFSYVGSKPPEAAIKELSEAGLLTETGGRITLKVNYEAALKTLFRKA